jgi:aryl-alcohol dehydrogenase-like predicted oxidoreductase
MISTSFSASRQGLERLIQAPVDLLGQSAEQNKATQIALAWLLAQKPWNIFWGQVR